MKATTLNVGLALSRLQAALRPARPADVLDTLAELALLVEKRENDDDISEARMAAYLQRLQAYPGDIVLFVLKAWPDRSKFWPTWAELREALDERFAKRRVMLPALQRIDAPRREADGPPSTAEIAEMRAKHAVVRAQLDAATKRMKAAVKAGPGAGAVSGVLDDRLKARREAEEAAILAELHPEAQP
ncbi:MAG: hypothetical protein AB7O04_15910 [Hyphomonadaceae bacterium]